MRKCAFATHGIYGSEPELDIEGVWLFTEKEIPQEMREHDLFEYFQFKQLNVELETDSNLIREFWTKTKEGELVNGRPVFFVEFYN